MNDAELEVLYKASASESHAAALRAVFNAGYQSALIQPDQAAPLPPTPTEEVTAEPEAPQP